MPGAASQPPTAFPTSFFFQMSKMDFSPPTGMNASKHQFLQNKNWQGLWLLCSQGGRAETLVQHGQDKGLNLDVY